MTKTINNQQTLQFTSSQDDLLELGDRFVKRAIALGATEACVEVNESIDTHVSILNGQIDNLETCCLNLLSLVVYVGKKTGSLSISAGSVNNIDDLLKQAFDIAKYTQEDSAHGLLEPEYLANITNDSQTQMALELFHDNDITNGELIQKAKNIEQLACALDSRIAFSDGVSIDIGKTNFALVTSNGFAGGYQTTRYNNSISLIGKSNSDNMQTDYWYSHARDFNDLLSDEQLAAKAVARVTRRLDAGKLTSGAGKYSVIFEAPIAKGLISSLCSALSGGALYRKLSFLNDSLNVAIMPNWFNIVDDPYVLRGMGSCYFDDEGGKVTKRNIITDGVVSNYFLSSYTARKMGKAPTGNGGGHHNILVKPNHHGGLHELIKQMQNGIIVIETIGHGLNMVSGDYSVGASGLLVKHGVITQFVDNITIAGNLKDLFKQIQYVSDDNNAKDSVSCGSILIDGVSVAS